MQKRPSSSAKAAQLRSRAEAHLREQKKLKTGVAKTGADSRRLLHELQVHQIELEMQNAELRQARDELEVALENYTDLYDFAPSGYFTLAATGAILRANLTGATLVGIERSRLVGQSFGGLVSDEFRPAFSTFLAQVFAVQTKQSGDFELACKGQPLRFVNIEAQCSPNGQECRAAVVDLTARRFAEATTTQLAAIVNSSSDAIIGKDLNSIITSWNAGAEKIFGYSSVEVLGCPISRLIPADRLQEDVHIMSQVKRGERVKPFETVRLVKGGRLLDMSMTVSPIWSATGKIVGASIVASDITERKAAEVALRRNEALFSALIEQAPVGVYVVDAQLRLRQVNPRAFPVFKNAHPLIGRDFSEIIQIIWSSRVAYQIVARFRHTLNTGESYQSPEFSERHQDTGLKEFYEWQLQRVTLPAGEHGVVCFFNNITERKQAEAAQRRLEVMTASNRKLEQEIIRRKTLEQALKTSEKQLRQLSHEILLTQEAERKRISRELHDTVLQTLVGINIHLASLTPKPVDNPTSLRRKIAQTQRLVEKSLAMVHRFAVELRPTVLDDLGLIPALHTFLKDFMKRTGVRASLTAYAAVNQLPIDQSAVLYRVALEALNNVAIHAQASVVEVEITKLPDWICLTIKDDGKSFDVKRVLRTKGNGRLGLLGMRERLQMVGGKFSIKSETGHGTTVTARIPVNSESAEKGGKQSSEIKS
jgi:PAS domain S-box-containing protein